MKAPARPDRRAEVGAHGALEALLEAERANARRLQEADAEAAAIRASGEREADEVTRAAAARLEDELAERRVRHERELAEAAARHGDAARRDMARLEALDEETLDRLARLTTSWLPGGRTA